METEYSSFVEKNKTFLKNVAAEKKNLSDFVGKTKKELTSLLEKQISAFDDKIKALNDKVAVFDEKSKTLLGDFQSKLNGLLEESRNDETKMKSALNKVKELSENFEKVYSRVVDFRRVEDAVAKRMVPKIDSALMKKRKELEIFNEKAVSKMLKEYQSVLEMVSGLKEENNKLKDELSKIKKDYLTSKLELTELKIALEKNKELDRKVRKTLDKVKKIIKV